MKCPNCLGKMERVNGYPANWECRCGAMFTQGFLDGLTEADRKHLHAEHARMLELRANPPEERYTPPEGNPPKPRGLEEWL